MRNKIIPFPGRNDEDAHSSLPRRQSDLEKNTSLLDEWTETGVAYLDPKERHKRKTLEVMSAPNVALLPAKKRSDVPKKATSLINVQAETDSPSVASDRNGRRDSDLPVQRQLVKAQVTAFLVAARRESEASLTRFKIHSLATTVVSTAVALVNVVYASQEPWSLFVILVGVAFLLLHLTSLFDRRQQAREAANLPAISRSTLKTVADVFAVRRRDTFVWEPLYIICFAGAAACIVATLMFARGWAWWWPTATLGLLSAFFILLHTNARKQVRASVAHLHQGGVEIDPRTTTDLEAQRAQEAHLLRLPKDRRVSRGVH